MFSHIDDCREHIDIMKWNEIIKKRGKGNNEIECVPDEPGVFCWQNYCHFP